MKANGFMLAMLMVMLAGGTYADAASPAGVWRTIDDKSKKERSVIRITESGGEFRGVVEKLFDEPGEDPAHLCKDCKGERKDKPIIGMTILWGLKKDGDGWGGGEILDPKNGKIYRAKMSLSEDGNSLNVRGFIGISLIGRSQTWHRER
jgi:uncharacterized protein (DUF2147 family)